jgi:predicted KAP-like P-loop ATPase
LPNIVYLLAYERRRIVAMLSEPPFKLDSDFLEKIIQYEVPVPILDPAGLPALLDKALTPILPDASNPKREEANKRIGSAYYYILREYLRQPCDINRLSNALQVAMATLANRYLAAWQRGKSDRPQPGKETLD